MCSRCRSRGRLLCCGSCRGLCRSGLGTWCGGRSLAGTAGLRDLVSRNRSLVLLLRTCFLRGRALRDRAARDGASWAAAASRDYVSLLAGFDEFGLLHRRSFGKGARRQVQGEVFRWPWAHAARPRGWALSAGPLSSGRSAFIRGGGLGGSGRLSRLRGVSRCGGWRSR